MPAAPPIPLPGTLGTVVMRELLSFLLFFSLIAAGPEQLFAAGAACVMAKYQGRTLDYELVVTGGHPSEAQEEATARLREKGYGAFHKNLDIMRPQNLTNLPHAHIVVIRSEFRDSRGKERSAMGCGFSGVSFDEALWDALRDGQSFYWGWKPDRDGYEVVRKLRY